MIWVLLACRGDDRGPWTAEAALASTAALDGEAALSADSYERRRYAAAPFTEADQNQDGTLSPAELLPLLQQHDPLTFDSARPMAALNKEAWAQPFSTPALQRATWELLAFLRAEISAVAPETELPNDETLRAAAATEDLYSDQVQGVLISLQTLHLQHGLSFPTGLIREE